MTSNHGPPQPSLRANPLSPITPLPEKFVLNGSRGLIVFLLRSPRVCVVHGDRSRHPYSTQATIGHDGRLREAHQGSPVQPTNVMVQPQPQTDFHKHRRGFARRKENGLRFLFIQNDGFYLFKKKICLCFTKKKKSH